MKFPNVSIVVPVYNEEKNINKLANLLIKQNFPGKFEIIFIDNNSQDQTYNKIKYLSEHNKNIKSAHEKKQGSYAARNKGIKKSSYKILAFIDSDCIPGKKWLKNGIQKLINEQADLVGGRVKFQFKNKNNPAEILDSITNMQIKRNIAERKVAKTANLFVKKEVISKIGNFPKDFISGGDVWFTKKATDSNFRLVYAPNAVVYHPTRTLIPLLKKQFRVGKGKAQIWIYEKMSIITRIKKLLSYLLPPKISNLKKLVGKQHKLNPKNFFLVWIVLYICNLFSFLGATYKLLKAE